MAFAVSRAVLILLLSVAPARHEGERLFNAGTAAYKAGHYEEALADFAASYEALPLAQVLFDIAQCDRKLGRWKEAEKQYQHYLAALPKAPNRAEVLAFLAQVRAAQLPTAPAAPPPAETMTAYPAAEAATPAPPPPAWPAEPSKLEPPPAQVPIAAVTEPAPAPQRHRSSGPYWLGGAGILVALVGGGFAIAGEVMEGPDHPTGSNPVLHTLNAQTVTTANNLLAASYVLLGVGAAAVVGGGIWAVVDRPASATP